MCKKICSAFDILRVPYFKKPSSTKHWYFFVKNKQITPKAPFILSLIEYWLDVVYSKLGGLGFKSLEKPHLQIITLSGTTRSVP